MKLRRLKKYIWARSILSTSMLNGHDNSVSNAYIQRWKKP